MKTIKLQEQFKRKLEAMQYDGKNDQEIADLFDRHQLDPDEMIYDYNQRHFIICGEVMNKSDWVVVFEETDDDVADFEIFSDEAFNKVFKLEN